MLFFSDASRSARQCVFALSFFAVSMSLGSTAVLAADRGVSTYQQERAACLNGQSHQDKATCLREANNARGEAKRGNLNDGATSFEQNAVTRCNVLPAADQQDCIRRATGGGATAGSVESGGVYRETRTTIIDPQPQPQPMPAPMPAPVPRY
jgi:hypothetical protein